MNLPAPETVRTAFARMFPPACAGCDGSSTPTTAFCDVCRPVAPRLTPPYCARCAVPMTTFDADDDAADGADAPSECSRCRKESPSFDAVVACWEYDEAVADAMRRIKYGGDLPALRALCRGARPWFRRQLQRLADDTPLVPVPTHPVQLRRRGFHVPNLALRWLGIADRTRHLLRKVRPTPQQAGLSLAERKKNVRDVFHAPNDTPPGAHAVIFDDVMTTGATADAAAAALKNAGFARVSIVVLARAVS